jgi:hypothetical protein
MLVKCKVALLYVPYSKQMLCQFKVLLPIMLF